MPYTIGEVARMMNIAPSTLRYYEKEGLLSLGVRASNGQRTYTDDDIATLSIIEYLKFCGLPLKEIRSFLPLIRPGGETLSARRDILAKERDNVRAQIVQIVLPEAEPRAQRLELRCALAECLAALFVAGDDLHTVSAQKLDERRVAHADAEHRRCFSPQGG